MTTLRCELPGCSNLLPEDALAGSRRYCSQDHRLAARRLRREQRVTAPLPIDEAAPPAAGLVGAGEASAPAAEDDRAQARARRAGKLRAEQVRRQRTRRRHGIAALGTAAAVTAAASFGWKAATPPSRPRPHVDAGGELSTFQLDARTSAWPARATQTLAGLDSQLALAQQAERAWQALPSWRRTGPAATMAGDLSHRQALVAQQKAALEADVTSWHAYEQTLAALRAVDEQLANIRETQRTTTPHDTPAATGSALLNQQMHLLLTQRDMMRNELGQWKPRLDTVVAAGLPTVPTAVAALARMVMDDTRAPAPLPLGPRRPSLPPADVTAGRTHERDGSSAPAIPDGAPSLGVDTIPDTQPRLARIAGHLPSAERGHNADTEPRLGGGAHLGGADQRPIPTGPASKAVAPAAHNLSPARLSNQPTKALLPTRRHVTAESGQHAGTVHPGNPNAAGAAAQPSGGPARMLPRSDGGSTRHSQSLLATSLLATPPTLARTTAATLPAGAEAKVAVARVTIARVAASPVMVSRVAVAPFAASPVAASPAGGHDTGHPASLSHAPQPAASHADPGGQTGGSQSHPQRDHPLPSTAPADTTPPAPATQRGPAHEADVSDGGHMSVHVAATSVSPHATTAPGPSAGRDHPDSPGAQAGHQQHQAVTPAADSSSPAAKTDDSHTAISQPTSDDDSSASNRSGTERPSSRPSSSSGHSETSSHPSDHRQQAAQDDPET